MPVATDTSAAPADNVLRICTAPSIVLLLWLTMCEVADTAGQAAALGITAAQVGTLKERFAEELEELRRLNLVGGRTTRPLMARLARGRVAELSLTARTPTELAALARAIRTLPDWVWDDATVQGDGSSAKAPVRGYTTSAAGTATPLAGSGASALLEEQRLNRAARRRQEKLERG
jgi:hypothetical protein